MKKDCGIILNAKNNYNAYDHDTIITNVTSYSQISSKAKEELKKYAYTLPLATAAIAGIIKFLKPTIDVNLYVTYGLMIAPALYHVYRIADDFHNLKCRQRYLDRLEENHGIVILDDGISYTIE